MPTPQPWFLFLLSLYFVHLNSLSFYNPNTAVLFPGILFPYHKWIKHFYLLLGGEIILKFHAWNHTWVRTWVKHVWTWVNNCWSWVMGSWGFIILCCMYIYIFPHLKHFCIALLWEAFQNRSVRTLPMTSLSLPSQTPQALISICTTI